MTTTLRITLLGVLLVLVSALSLAVGAEHVPIGDVWGAVVDFSGSSAQIIVHDVRLPRLLLGVAVGAGLAMAGALLQTITRNPVAEPGLMGVTTGAGLAIVIGSLLGIAATQEAVMLLAAVGAVFAIVLVAAIGGGSPLRLILTGVSLTWVFSGLSLGLRMMTPGTFDRFRFWSVGTLAGREQLAQALPLTVIAVSLICGVLLTRALAAIVLGDEVAQSLGVPVRYVRLAALGLATALSAATTAVAGPIAFVGLVVPHLARRFAGASMAKLMAYTLLIGPILVITADIAARVLLPTGEVPVEVVTAFAGGLVLIWVVHRRGVAEL